MLEELRSKKVNDLRLQENELREELFKLKLQKGAGQLEKTHQLGELRKNIARVKTVLKEKLDQESKGIAEPQKRGRKK